eukprot:3486769-Rhodomonas_salina.1
MPASIIRSRKRVKGKKAAKAREREQEKEGAHERGGETRMNIPKSEKRARRRSDERGRRQ